MHGHPMLTDIIGSTNWCMEWYYVARALYACTLIGVSCNGSLVGPRVHERAGKVTPRTWWRGRWPHVHGRGEGDPLMHGKLGRWPPCVWEGGEGDPRAWENGMVTTCMGGRRRWLQVHRRTGKVTLTSVTCMGEREDDPPRAWECGEGNPTCMGGRGRWPHVHGRASKAPPMYSKQYSINHWIY